MSQLNIPEINVSEIMKKIREEINKNTSRQHGIDPYSIQQREAKFDSINPTVNQTRLWQTIKTIQFRLRKYPFYGFTYRLVFRFIRFIPKYRTSFTIEDFIKYDEVDFINNAYKGILLREADEQGLNLYLSKMRTGSLNKVQVLASLRYSKEGRAKRTYIKNLYLSYVAIKFNKLPVIGYAIRWATAVLKMPLIVRNLTAFENYTNTRFNRSDNIMTTAVNNLTNIISQKADIETVQQLKHALEQKADAQMVQMDINSMIQQIRDQKLNILSQQKNLASLIERLDQRMSEVRTAGVQRDLRQEEAHQYDALYVSFEDRFRGARSDIKERLKFYLPYIEKVNTNKTNKFILDIGCGRGEWLELMKEQGYTAKGIDTNRLMVDQCAELGLDAIESDAIEYLKSQKPNSFDVITGFHIVEHLPFRTLIDLFDDCFRVLKSRGMILFETPNPENIIVGSCNFFTDPTHLHPIPPSTLKFFAEQRGFGSCEIKYITNTTIHLDNVYLDEFFNSRITISPDYCIIAYK